MNMIASKSMPTIPNNPSIFGSIISKNIKTTPITCPIDNGGCFNSLFKGSLYNYRPFLICSEVNKLLKGISLLKSQQRNSALNHIRVSQILYKYVLRRINNQQIRLSVAEIINTAKTP